MKYLFTTAVMLLCLRAVTVAQDNNYGVKGFYPQTLQVTDSAPVLLNGIKAGYEIRSVDADSKKDNQAKYKIYFYLTNTSTEAKIMYQNSGFMGHSGPINNNFALFKCLNATGARFTNKMCSMELQACNMMAKVEDKDCNGKTTINTRQVEIGYWLKPGETVSKTYPMYIPQSEKPKVTVTFYPEVANQTGTMMNGNSNNAAANNISFSRIKNFASGTYLNNQQGPLQCTAIENGWWSADWEIRPMEGTENFYIVSRWKNTYISSTANGMLAGNSNDTNAMWLIQESNTPNVFYIKNVSGNGRLYVENGILKVSSSFISNDALTKWIIEK